MSPSRKKKDWKKTRNYEILERMDKKFYIFCEGIKTEPNYFLGFKALIEKNPIYKHTVLVEVEGVGDNTIRILEYAENYSKREKIQNAQIWCVYDKDDFPSQNFNAVSERVARLNTEREDLQYYVAWSNQCIEYWFILHFDYFISDNNRDDYITYLNQKFLELGYNKYHKNDANIFDKLVESGNPKHAIRYANKRCEACHGLTDSNSSPATKVHLLVIELAKYMPDDIKMKFI